MTKEQANYVYKRVNAGREIYTETIKQEIAQQSIDDSCDNTYQKAILSNIDKREKKVPTQIEEWSIFSDHVKYVRHDDGSGTFHKLSINTLNYHQNKDLYKELKEKVMLKVNVNFGRSPEKLNSEYLDVYDGVYTEVVSTNRFDEDTDLSTTYLGQVNMSRDTEVRAGKVFHYCKSHTRGELLDGTYCEILIDTGVSKFYMSKSYFM